MHSLSLSPVDFDLIVRCCRRLLVNDSTDPDDLRHFLVARVADDSPALAAAIAGFSEPQMQELRDEVAAALKGKAVATEWW
jgi:hypothetical protein